MLQKLSYKPMFWEVIKINGDDVICHYTVSDDQQFYIFIGSSRVELNTTLIQKIKMVGENTKFFDSRLSNHHNVFRTYIHKVYNHKLCAC